MRLRSIASPSGLSWGFLTNTVLPQLDGEPRPSMHVIFRVVRAATSPAATAASVLNTVNRLMTRDQRRRDVSRAALDAYAALASAGAQPKLTDVQTRDLMIAEGVGSLEFQSQAQRFAARFPRHQGIGSIYDHGFDHEAVWRDTAGILGYGAHLLQRAGLVLSHEDLKRLDDIARADLLSDVSFDAASLPTTTRSVYLPEPLRLKEATWALEPEIDAPQALPREGAALPHDEFWDSAAARAEALLADRDPNAMVSQNDLRALFGGAA